MKKISAVIITFNEEANIRRCLTSLHSLVDEIIVVDSFSTDNTEKICREFNVNFITNAFAGHIEQKNFAMEKATYPFVLSLDADEALTGELAAAIHSIKSSSADQSVADAYAFNRLNFYCGKFIRHGVWYPDRKIRLWDRTKGRWGGENPHDTVIMQPGSVVKKLDGDLLHYSYSSITAHVQQMNKFSDIAAREAFRKGKTANVFIHLVVHPFTTFLKSYIFRLGFLDGHQGYLVAVSAAYYRYLKYSKLLQLNSTVKNKPVQ